MRRIKLFAILMAMLMLLTSCAMQETQVVDAQPPTADSQPPVDYTQPPVADTQPPADKPDEPVVELSEFELRIAALADRTISEQERITMLIGGVDTSIGIYRTWYDNAFGERFHGIPTYFLDIVEDYDAVRTWLRERSWDRTDAQGGKRIFLLAFIEDFNITAGEIIRAHEEAFDRPMVQIDTLVNWVRYSIDTGVIAPGDNWLVERHFYSLSDIEAFFSGDIDHIWEISPGYGVVQNGRVYAPSWIINNIEAAVLEHQIPESEIRRIIETFEEFYTLYNEVSRARIFLEEMESALTLDSNEGTPYLGEGFDLGGDDGIDDVDL